MGLRMISCEEASKLISESMDHSVPFLEKISLKIHLAMCKVCPTYMRQLHFLREVVKSWADKTNHLLSDKSLSQETKSRIKLHLKSIFP